MFQLLEDMETFNEFINYIYKNNFQLIKNKIINESYNNFNINLLKEKIKKGQNIIKKEFDKFDTKYKNKYQIFYMDENTNNGINDFISGKDNYIPISCINQKKYIPPDDNDFNDIYDKYDKMLNNIENLFKKELKEFELDIDNDELFSLFYISIKNENEFLKENYNINIYNYKNFDINNIFKECKSIKDVIKISLQEDMKKKN